MFRQLVFGVFLLLLLLQAAIAQTTFDVQGHRGARGLMPENTIPAMIEAVRLGVSTLELDVVITADQKVLLSHEPWMNADICLDANGQELSSSKGKQINIYTLTYDEITAYDCGSKGNSRYPEQQKIPVHKPLLADVFQAVERYTKEHKLTPVQYNIEIKSSTAGDGKQHPTPELYADLVLAEVANAGLYNRITIQSFDTRPLQYLNNKNVPVKMSLLIESQTNFEGAIRELGFIPTVYSPNYRLINKKLMAYASQMGMKVIPWTVNDTDDMRRMLEFGVDGIITDYPNRLLNLLRESTPATGSQ